MTARRGVNTPPSSGLYHRALRRVRPLPAVCAAVTAALLAASSGGMGPAIRAGGTSAHRGPVPPATAMFVSPTLTMGNLAYRLSQMTPVIPAPVAVNVAPPVTPAPRATPGTPARTPQMVAQPAAAVPATAVVRPAPSTAPLGAMLLDGCSWAPMIPGCSARLSVYSNGGNINARFDCMQLVRRWLRWAWNDLPIGGSAAQLWGNAAGLPVPLAQHPNGGPDSPNFGDVLVFAATPAWPAGHVGIVAGSHNENGRVYLDVVEQNGDPSGLVSFPVTGTTVIAQGRTPLLGWLRPAVPGPLPRPAVPLTVTAAWPGGGGTWSGASATFDGPGGATITGHWSGFMCIGVRHDWPDGSRFATGSCFWNGATVTTPDPSTASGTYSVVIEPGTEPPI